MQTTLKNKKKVVAIFPRSAPKRKNRVEGRASSLGVKREQENINLRAQKMMRGKVEPFIMLTMVRAIKQTNNNTIDDISTRETTEGAKAGDTIDDIATREIVEGAEPRS